VLIEVAVALFTGGFLGYALRALKVASDGPKPRLPPAGGQPQDRAEAVRRILKHLERKTISELSEGNAAVIEGTVRASSAPGLTSPHGGARCIGYHLDVRLAWMENFKFRQIYEEARCGDFEIEDATGVIRVSGVGLELAITDGPFVFVQRVPPPLQSRVHHPGPLTIEEGVLLPGANVLVCGVVTSELSVTDYRDGKPIYTLRATPSFPLVASTDRDLFLPGSRPIAPEELHRRNRG
jgi:hypothetical protein